MNKLLKKVSLSIQLLMLVLFGNSYKVKAQITVDSLKKQFAKIALINNAEKYSAAIIQMHNLFFSDSLMLLDLRSAEAVKKTMGDKSTIYAIALTKIAILYMWKGEYDKAFPLLQQSMEIFKNVQKKENIIAYPMILNNLGILYERMGQYDKALVYYQQGLDIKKKILKENDPLYALLYPISLSSLATLYIRMDQYGKALPLLEQAIQIRKEKLGEAHPYYALSLSDLALFYSNKGNNEKALPLFKQSLEIYKKVFGEDDFDYIKVLDNLATVYKNMGNFEQAMPLLQQVLEWRKKKLGEDNPSCAPTLNNMGLLYSMSGNFKEASSLFIKADNISLKYLSQTYSSLSEQEKIIFLNQESEQFNYLPSVLFTTRMVKPEIVNQVYANEVALKGMVLEDQQQVLHNMRQSGDSNALRIYKRWCFNRALIGKQLLLLKTQRALNLDSIAEATNLAEEELSRRSVAFRQLQRIQNISAKSVSEHLVKGEAVIEFLRFKLHKKKWTDSTMYAAMVLLPKDSNARFVSLFEEKQLQHLLKPSANSETPLYLLYPSHFARKPGATSNALYSLIWKPLEKYLKDVNTIYYAPAGLLHRIAFQALHPDATHLLIDKYQLNQLLSTRSVALAQQITQKPGSACIWGDIEYNLETSNYASADSNSNADTTASFFNMYAWDTRGIRDKEWNPLPGTKKEIDSVRNILQNAGLNITTDSGAVATEEDFKALDGKSPKILHIATHGFFLSVEEIKSGNIYNTDDGINNSFTVQQNPMFRSGLVLAGANHAWKGEAAIPGREDGILTAYEIAQMDLSNTDLVVLSACETALGDLQGNEGVIGLQRAFKIAGVKQMMVSLWQVPDKETTELMTLFYKTWLSRQTTRQALRSAQLKMKEKYSPYYWAGFVLVE